MPSRTGKSSSKGRGSRRRLPLPQLIIAVGIVLCMAPLISNLWAQYEASQYVSQLTDEAERLDDSQKQYLLAQAQAYNAVIGGYADGTEGEILPYEKQLNSKAASGEPVTDEGGAMSWIEVPRAAIKAVVYHGVSDAALAAGAGHMPSTSLPVGGERALCVVTGHSGLQRQRIFDGLRALEPGDVFAFHTLGEPFAYRVTRWEIVDPEDVVLTPQDGDQACLITCTTSPDAFSPKGRIGINDKRLVIWGTRTEYDPAEFGSTPPDPSVYVNDNTLPAIIAAVLLALVLAGTIARKVAKRRRAKRLASEQAGSVREAAGAPAQSEPADQG